MAEHRGGSGSRRMSRQRYPLAWKIAIHPTQAVKAVSIAAVILKMIRNAHLKRVKKAVNKTVVINQVNPDSPLIINIS